MNSQIQAGTEKKLRTFLAYLTRLRQAVGHPYLLEGVLKDNFTLEDFHYLTQQLAKLDKTPMHQQVQRWMAMEYEAKDAEPTTFGKSRFGYEFDMTSQLKEAESTKSMEDVICRLCYDLPRDAKITEVCDNMEFFGL